MIALGTKRPLIGQQFRTFSFAVGVTPLPIAPDVDLTKLITTFVISNPIAGASVYFGNGGVSTTTGLEIQPGTAPVFEVAQTRQLYELQGPLLDINAAMQCRRMEAEPLPFVVWDMTQVFLVAAAATTVSIGLFPTMYL